MPGLRALRILPIMPDQPCIRAKGKERGKVTVNSNSHQGQLKLLYFVLHFISPKCARSMYLYSYNEVICFVYTAQGRLISNLN